MVVAPVGGPDILEEVRLPVNLSAHERAHPLDVRLPIKVVAAVVSTKGVVELPSCILVMIT